MGIVKINWEVEVRKRIAEHFKSLGIVYDDTRNLQDMLIDFFNLEMKLVKAVPRIIYISDKIKSIRIPPQNRRALDYIINKLKRGESVNTHQSKKTLNPL